MELHYNYAVEKLEMGSGFSHVSAHPLCSFLLYGDKAADMLHFNPHFELFDHQIRIFERWNIWRCEDFVFTEMSL